ncbi:ferrous iron transport protein B [Candidatus Roizmanbacteria bacterium]|nr:ferrous iron transport protein B [Candidatus Roizmanbacteria bacterium]
MKKITIAFVGNPNTGKTSLINTLSKARLKIGNWPGVTVEKKEATVFFQDYKIHLIDLPGVYSLHQDTNEGKITHDFLRNTSPDLIVNVVDSTNLQTNLPLTLQTSQCQIPMCIVLNFWQEFQDQGHRLDTSVLSDLLKCAIIPFDANNKKGRVQFLSKLLKVCHEKSLPALLNTENIYQQARDLERRVCTQASNTVMSITDKIDKILLHHLFAIPLLLFVFYLVFKITFNGSRPFVNEIKTIIDQIITPLALTVLHLAGTPTWIQSLVINGFIAGIGTVLSYLPLMMILYLFLGLLEESGYIARVAFVMDRILRPFGLQGKAFIPLLIGFGCNVPAIYATRTLEKESDKKITAIITSFMSCGAKLPIYVLFASVFFPGHAALVTIGLYCLGILVAVCISFILKKIWLKDAAGDFIIELPQYRIPSLGIILNSAWTRTFGFLKRAGTIIVIIVILMWTLMNLPYGAKPEESILGKSAKVVSPLFMPLGWGNSWEAVSSIIPGFLAKEAVISSLASTYSSNSIQPEYATSQQQNILPSAIRRDFTPLTALSFMIFNLLLFSCIGVTAAINQEFGRKFVWLVIGITFFTAYGVSLIVFTLGKLLGF